MKKYIFLMLTAVGWLLASCTFEDELASIIEDGDALTTITVGIPDNALATRSAVFENPALSGMRVVLLVSDKTGDKVVYDEIKTGQTLSGDNKVQFSVRLVKGQKYNISAWCDFGSTYYTVPDPASIATSNIAPKVTLAATAVTGSDNRYDAYFKNEAVTITDNSSIDLVCQRPFALVKVNTTDWTEPAVVNAGFQPTQYSTSITAPTELYLVSGAASNPQAVSITGYVPTTGDADASTSKELSFDYIFAGTEKSALDDFIMTYFNDANPEAAPITTYTFQNIPVQRNFKTNITGNILTKEGSILVTIDPAWSEPEAKVFPTFDAAQEYINSHRGETDASKLVISEEFVPNVEEKNAGSI